MSKVGLRGFAGGLFVATSVMAYMYYFHSDDVETVSETEAVHSPEATDDLNDLLSNYLEEQHLVAITEEEYNTLLQSIQEQETNAANDEANQKEIIYQVFLNISPGMSSGQVASYLEKAQIIESRSDFQRYLEKNKLTQAIKPGDYTFTSDMSFSEIADRIT
ncbi:hypothetical protein ACJ2A9_05400 [Anaerobacillus sp. MEB173]|uniref:hypothetical protein n=1 Tax=Anaerobacillus sp. MEB173 TaxID=3383345 RepID=UPI003F90C7FB